MSKRKSTKTKTWNRRRRTMSSIKKKSWPKKWSCLKRMAANMARRSKRSLITTSFKIKMIKETTCWSLSKRTRRTSFTTSLTRRNQIFVATTLQTTPSLRNWRATKKSPSTKEDQRTRTTSSAKKISRRRPRKSSQRMNPILSKRSQRTSVTKSFSRSSITSRRRRSWAICIPAA